MERTWTFLVYLAGDNNLEAFAGRNLLEMKRPLSTDAVAVLAQVDGLGDHGALRYCLTGDRPLAADVAAQLPETNTGDPGTLLDFISWGLGECPARHTALVLWNHGSGWKDDDIYAQAQRLGLSGAELTSSLAPRSLVRDARPSGMRRALFASSIRTALTYPAAQRAILFDDTSRDFLDNHELSAVLQAVVDARGGRQIDLIGFDACLMSMIEVAAQVAPYCGWMVGSQEIEPGDGWPYAQVLARLSASPDLSSGGLAAAVVESYGWYYGLDRPGILATQSALCLARAGGLVDDLDGLSRRLVESLALPGFYGLTLMPALRKVQKFRDEQYVDLGHLAELLAAGSAPPALQDAARAVSRRLEPRASDGLVAAVTPAAQAGPQKPGSHISGVSIYLPVAAPVSPAYQALEFSRRCAWGRFLAAFAES